MCGICGIFDSKRPVSEQTVRAMTRQLSHRGPDDEGYYFRSEVGLGMRRLSIIDIDGGRQPIHNEDRTVWIVFNGEIYNYRELRSELEARGHRFATDTDTEVIVHLYEEEGTGCLKALNGMFGFAIWDERKQRLFAARDRLGIKPLYYAYDGTRLALASELKALMVVPDISGDIDPAAVSDYLTFMYIPAPRTPFKAVCKLLPGHYLTCDRNGIKSTEYWSIKQVEPHEVSEREAAEQVDALLKDSVRLRLRSDVPVGAFLSGGLDSSSIVAYGSELRDSPLSTFAVGFGEDQFNELGYAGLVARAFGTRHREVQVTASDALRELPRLLWHLDEPLGDSAILPTYIVSKLARREVSVILSGVGGDELFGGYARYFVNWTRGRHLRRIPTALLSGFLLPVAGWVGGGLHRRMARATAPEADRYLGYVHRFAGEERTALLGGDMPAGGAEEGRLQAYFDGIRTADPTNRLLRVDAQTYLPDDILALTDRMSMAVSLEARVPFLDHRLVEYATALPSRYKIDRRNWKIVLKEAVAPRMPKEILNRIKWGFGAPVEAWHRKVLNGLCREILLSPELRRRGILNAEAVARWVRMSEATRPPDGIFQKLWSLMVFELWCRIFLDGALAPHDRLMQRTDMP